MTHPRVIAALVAVLAAPPALSWAQPETRALSPGRVVVGLGGAWVGADALGGVTAETRRSALGTTSPPPFTLFDTRSRLDGAPAVEATLTVAVTRRWAVALRGATGRPTLTTTISGDAEAPGTFTATERVAEYVADASVLYHPPWPVLGSRTRTYLLAGGGYLRQLHDEDVLVETGTSLHAGAGARLWLAGGRTRGRAAGITGELRWVFRRDGVTFRDGVRSLPVFSLGAFVGF